MDYKDIEKTGIELAEFLCRDSYFQPKTEYTPYSLLTDLVRGLVDLEELEATEDDLFAIRKCFIKHFQNRIENNTNYQTEIVNLDGETYLRIYKNE